MKTAELMTGAALCPACGEGQLHAQTEQQTVEHAGCHGQVAMRFSVCDACGSELATADDALANKRAMVAFEKQAEGLLSGIEVRHWRKQYHLTQQLAAGLLGGGKVGFSRYENDDISQSTAMDSLLRLCQQEPANLMRLAKLRQLQLPESTLQAITSHQQQALQKLLPRLHQALEAIKAQSQPRTVPQITQRKLKPAYLELPPANHERYAGSTWA